MHGARHASQAVINPGWTLNTHTNTRELPVRGDKELWFVLMHMNNLSAEGFLSGNKHAHIASEVGATPGYVFDDY